MKNNKPLEKNSFLNLEDIRRISIAQICPYWSPLLPFKSNSKIFENAIKKEYLRVSGEKFYFYRREKGCPYYEQYEYYIDSDVLVFNSLKYMIEVAIGRKPKTEIDIFDECDAFLDELSNQKRINLNRLVSSLNSLLKEDYVEKNKIKEMIRETNFLINEAENESIENLYESKFYVLFKKIIKNQHISLLDDENYFNSVLEVCKSFEGVESDSFVSYEVLRDEKKFSVLV